MKRRRPKEEKLKLGEGGRRRREEENTLLYNLWKMKQLRSNFQTLDWKKASDLEEGAPSGSSA